jgi:hypothetical protein
MKTVILGASVIMGLTGCGKVMETAQINASSGSPVTTIPATPAQCPTGGIVVTQNGVFTPICNGVAGIQGPAGATGQNGVGTVGPQGPAGATGQNGVGTVGPQGPAGATGQNGSNGTNGNGFNPGLDCDVYTVVPADENGTVNWAQMLSDGTPKFVTTLANFNVPNESSNGIFATFTPDQQALIGTTNYGLDCYGWLNVPETGVYTLNMGSDDGSELVIDNAVVINMPELQAYTNKSASMTLFAGMHRINVMYFQGPPTNIGLTISWQGPSNAGLGTLATIPASYFMH